MANKAGEPDRCPSCGETWVNHGGVAITCAKLLRCKRVIRLIMKLTELDRMDITHADVSAISEICKRVLKEVK